MGNFGPENDFINPFQLDFFLKDHKNLEKKKKGRKKASLPPKIKKKRREEK